MFDCIERAELARLQGLRTVELDDSVRIVEKINERLGDFMIFLQVRVMDHVFRTMRSIKIV